MRLAHFPPGFMCLIFKGDLCFVFKGEFMRLVFKGDLCFVSEGNLYAAMMWRNATSSPRTPHHRRARPSYSG
jgi:hypothetical protein